MKKCAQTDLNLYFKNYSSKVYTCYNENGLHHFRNTKKFSLHFSDFSTIFYEFYKISVNSVKGEESFYTGDPGSFEVSQKGPYILRSAPWEKRRRHTLVLELTGGRAPAKRRRVRAGKEGENEEELTASRLG